jgi:hypothetical protein
VSSGKIIGPKKSRKEEISEYCYLESLKLVAKVSEKYWEEIPGISTKTVDNVINKPESVSLNMHVLVLNLSLEHHIQHLVKEAVTAARHEWDKEAKTLEQQRILLEEIARLKKDKGIS